MAENKDREAYLRITVLLDPGRAGVVPMGDRVLSLAATELMAAALKSRTPMRPCVSDVCGHPMCDLVRAIDNWKAKSKWPIHCEPMAKPVTG